MKVAYFIIVLFSLVLSTTAIAGVRSISMSSYFGNPAPLEKFHDELENLPVGNNAIIIGVETIKISFHSHVESIQLIYRLTNGSLYSTPRRGGTKYEQFSIKLAPGDFIEKIQGKTDGIYINQISLHIKDVKNYEDRICGPFGESEGKIFVIEGHVLGFYGRYNSSYLFGIGAIMLSSVKQGALFGTRPSPGNRVPGRNFEGHPDYLFSVPVAKITTISIGFNYLKNVSAIRVGYLLFDGLTVVGEWHGGKYYMSSTETISLDDTEWLIGIEGVLNNNIGDHVAQISFITLKESGRLEKYGPYGNPSGETVMKPFAAYGKHILGFSGNAWFYVFGISVYYDEE